MYLLYCSHNLLPTLGGNGSRTNGIDFLLHLFYFRDAFSDITDDLKYFIRVREIMQ